jgi:hypothetical protein
MRIAGESGGRTPRLPVQPVGRADLAESVREVDADASGLVVPVIATAVHGRHGSRRWATRASAVTEIHW